MVILIDHGNKEGETVTVKTIIVLTVMMINH